MPDSSMNDGIILSANSTALIKNFSSPSKSYADNNPPTTRMTVSKRLMLTGYIEMMHQDSQMTAADLTPQLTISRFKFKTKAFAC